MPHHHRRGGGVDGEARLGRRIRRRHHRPGQAEVGNAHRRDDAEVREHEDVAEAGVSDGNVPEPDVTPEVGTETDVIGGAGGGGAATPRDIDGGGGDQRDQVTYAHVGGRAKAQYASSAGLVRGEPSPLGGAGLADALVRVGPPREIGVIVVKVRGHLYQAREGRELDRRDQRQQQQRRARRRRGRGRGRMMSEEDFGMIADHPQRQGVADHNGDYARCEGVRPRGQLPYLKLGWDRALLLLPPLVFTHGEK